MQLDTNPSAQPRLDVTRTARKIKRQLKSDRPKIIALSIMTCFIAPLPYAGIWAALATGLLAFWVVAKGFLALHNFEMDMQDAGLSDEEIDQHLPSYQPLLVNAGVCLFFLIAAAIVASKLAGSVREWIGAIS